MKKLRILFCILVTASPLFSQYNFDFVCTSDTFQTGTDYFAYYFRLTNTGTQPDSYAFDCRVIDSVPNWFELYCAGGQCAEPGVILYDYLVPGAVDSGIDISVYPASGVWGTEKINLLVWSMGNPNLRDSINVYAAMEQGIIEQKCVNKEDVELLFYPNPFKNYCVIKFQIPNSNSHLPALYSLLATLKIYDVSGRLVNSFNLESCILNQESSIIWSGDDKYGNQVPGGVYIIQLVLNGTKKQKCIIKIQ